MAGDVTRKVLQVLDAYNVWGVDLDERTPLIDAVGLDSVTMLQFVTELEREFQISIPDNEISRENFATVGQVCAFLTKRLEQNGDNGR